MKQKAYAVFILDKDFLFKLDTKGFSNQLNDYLDDHPINVYGDTHLAKFCRSRADREDGTLHNTMPGSTFTKYTFEKHVFGTGINSRVVIVGWYE